MSVLHQDFADKAHLRRDGQGRTAQELSDDEDCIDALVFFGISIMSILACIAILSV